MEENLTRAEVAAALGIAEQEITAMTVEPPRKGEKPRPMPEPKRYAYEKTIEIGRVGGHHVVFRRTRVWGDGRAIYSGAVSAAICKTAEEAKKQAEQLR